MSKDYKVGYRKPPKDTQFKKGQSGNPQGRPKGSCNFSTDLKDTLKEPVRLTKGGKPKTVSTQLATLWRLREKALAGDARSLDRYIELARTYNDEEIAAAVKLSQSDAEILEAYNEQQLRRAEEAPPDDNNDARDDAASDAPEPEDDDDAWIK